MSRWGMTLLVAGARLAGGLAAVVPILLLAALLAAIGLGLDALFGPVRDVAPRWW